MLDLLAGGDFISNPTGRTVRVPVKLLEHARFRLSSGDKQTGVGQGDAKPGDQLQPADPGQQTGAGEGGSDDGEFKLLLELKVDDLVDRLAEELKLPDLRPTSGATIEGDDIVHEGFGKRGIRARLDRRRTLKEALKRRESRPIPCRSSTTICATGS